MSLLIENKKPVTALMDKSILFFMALSLAEATLLLLFYYWVVTITYISPSQNLTLIPIMGDVLKWMYQVLL